MLRFAGEFVTRCALREAYEFLVDPHSLVKCLPDLEHHEIRGQNDFSITLRVGLGRVRGLMNMKMEIVNKKDSSYARILGRGSMLNSQVRVDGSFTLCEAVDGTTQVSWTGDAKIGGYLMDFLGGAIDGLVQQHLERFVHAMETNMTGRTPLDQENFSCQ